MLLWPNGNIHPKSIDNGINLRTEIYAKCIVSAMSHLSHSNAERLQLYYLYWKKPRF